MFQMIVEDNSVSMNGCGSLQHGRERKRVEEA